MPNVQSLFIRPRNIKEVTGLSRTTIWRLENKGDFPKRRKLSDNAVGWKASEVTAWMEAREAV
jgi:prophage regulatory protein